MTYLLAASVPAMMLAVASAQTAPSTPKTNDRQASELEYLRRLLEEQKKNPDKIIRTLPPANADASTNRAAPTPEKPVAISPPAAAPPVVPPATVAPTAQQEKISEVEARIDEMLRQKEAREKAALTNAAGATNNISATAQTKRQRLDALLKQFIEGKIPQAEYNEKRAKILAEPN